MTCPLRFRDFRLYRKDRLLLSLEDLAVEQGEILALIGPNGVGKSTLLQAVNGLLDTFEGTLEIFGAPLVGTPALSLRRRMAMVFQDSLLLRGTALENAALGLKYRGVGKGEREVRARQWLALFQVEHLAERHAYKLSGGEAQRVSLARALALEPEIFLMDEPFSALDPASRTRLMGELRAILKERRITTLFVTHNMKEVLAMADRAAVLLDGKMVQVGEPRKILTRPVSLASARFLGLDNVTEAAGGSDSIRLYHGEEWVELPWKGEAFARCPVLLRPEAMDLRKAPGGEEGQIRVSRIQGMTRDWQVEVQVAGNPAWTLSLWFSQREMERLDLHTGDAVELLLAPEAVHRFAEP